ncbi:GNAT family N-acetyltransferase [Halorhabdus salina]|uniref:GNAT family N-acetyltransferase n=1 Tax=Halorhabdus salina TaxID=2750670 RepID=UPI0015EF8780|nr:GNAT family N-acetyltransferase [Halorhabdus salina]
MDAVPLWRLTRTKYGRALWDALTKRGIRIARLRLYRTETFDVPEPSLSPDISLTVDRGDDLDSDAVDAPIAPDDWIVRAVAVDGIVGSVVLSIDRQVTVEPIDTALKFDGGYIWALYVAPAYRQRGIASALVAQALAVAADETEACLALVAPDNRPSQLVFEGQGFAVEGTLSHVGLAGIEWTSDLDELAGVQIVEG